MSRFVLSEPLDYDQFSRSPDIHNGVSGHDGFCKLFLMLCDKLGKPPYLGKDYLLQEVSPNVMGSIIGAAGAVVVGAVEVNDIRIPLIKVKVQCMPTVRTG